MDQSQASFAESSGSDPKTEILARVGTASGREEIAQDLQSGAYERHSGALKSLIDESIRPGVDRASLEARANREILETGLLGAAENPSLRKMLTENAEAYARKAGLPFEPVQDGERWAQPHALSPKLPESARGRLEVTTDAVNRTNPEGRTYGEISSLTERAATRDGRAQIAEEICTGKVRGGVQDIGERLNQAVGPNAADSLKSIVGDVRKYDPASRSFALHEADQPDSRQGVTEMAREKAQRQGLPFEEVDPTEPWDSKRPISDSSCYTASLDVGGAPNRSRSDVAQMIDRTDRQIAAETGSRTPVARGRDDALSL